MSRISRRKEILEWQQPYEQDEEEVLGKLIFTNNNIHKVKKNNHMKCGEKERKNLRKLQEMIKKE